MTYLLDTHALIWFINGDIKLSSKARRAIESSNNDNLVSTASIWELAIKIRLEKLELKIPFERIAKELSDNGFQVLQIYFEDLLTLHSLPLYHRDPFDRLIISQSITNRLTIITKDPSFESYNVKLLW